MSFVFTDVVLAVEAPDQPEAAQFSSTTRDVRLRLFTNDDLGVTNSQTGVAVGASNDAFYIGAISAESNVTRLLDVAIAGVAGQRRVAVQSEGASPDSFALWVGSCNVGAPGLSVSTRGEVGVGTEAIAGQALTVSGAIYATGISSATPGATFDFGGADVVNMNSLVVNGDITATGTFHVTDTQVQVTDQLYIENTGTGPALLANQTGLQPVAAFADDSNTVFYIQDGGAAAFGNFGWGAYPSVGAQVSIDSAAGSNYPGLKVTQRASGAGAAPIAEFVAAGAEAAGLGGCNVYVTAAGSIGVGTNEPSARMEIRHRWGPGADGDLLRLDAGAGGAGGAAAARSAVVVGADGRVGLGTDVAAHGAAAFGGADIRLSVRSGGLETETLSAARVTGLYSNALEFGSADLSNVGTVTLGAVGFVGAGGAGGGAGAVRIESGLGSSNVYVRGARGVGIGTDAPAVTLHIAATDGLLLPRGPTAQRPSGTGANGGDLPTGIIRYNTETTVFEGFGAGDTWGSLGGVKSVDGYTYITAELTPGANDSNLRFYTSGIERARITPTGTVGVGTEAPAAGAQLDVVGGAVRAAGGVRADTIGTLAGPGDAGALTVDPATVLEVSRMRGATAGATGEDRRLVDMGASALSNLTAVYTARIASTSGAAGAGAIDFSGAQASNVGVLRVGRVDSVYSTGTGGSGPDAERRVDFSALELSNVGRLSVARIGGADGAADGTIDATGATLSNISLDFVQRIRGSGAGEGILRVIDFASGTLSNISRLEAVSVAADRLYALTAGSPVDATGISLSNVGVLGVASIVGPAGAGGFAGAVDMSAGTLSNLALLSVARITTEAAGGALDFSAKHASNLASVSATTGYFSNIAPLPGLGLDAVDLSGVSVCNVAALYANRIVGTLDGGALDFSGTDLLGVGEVVADVVTARVLRGPTAAAGLIDLAQSSASNLASAEAGVALIGRIGPLAAGGGAAAAGSVVDFSGATAGNVGALRVRAITTDAVGGDIDMDARGLSNLARLGVSVIVGTAGTVGSAPASGVVDFSAGTLSNVAALRVNRIWTDAGAGAGTVIFGSPERQNDLSNVRLLSTDRIATNSGTGSLDVSGVALSNVAVLNVRRVDTDVRGPTGAAVLDMSAMELSNVGVVRASTLTTESAGVSLNLDARSVSNVATLGAVRLQTAAFGGAAGGIGGTVNFTGITASNVATLSVATITTSDENGQISLNSKSLTSVAGISVGRVVALGGAGDSVDFGGSVLSNALAVRTAELSGRVGGAGGGGAAGGGVVNVTGSELSNVGILRVGRVAAQTLGGAGDTGGAVDFSFLVLSNVGVVSLRALTTDVAGSGTSGAGGAIDFSDRGVSNVNTIYARALRGPVGAGGGSLDLGGTALSAVGEIAATRVVVSDSIASAAGAGGVINMSGAGLNNVFAVWTENLVATRVYGFGSGAGGGGILDLTASTVSNVAVLRVQRIAAGSGATDVAGGAIDVSQAWLSNVRRLDVLGGGANDGVVTSKVRAPASGGVLDFGGSALSNATRLTILPTGGGGVYTNVIGSASGSAINFSGANVVGVSNLDILGEFRVLGEVVINNVTTSNYTQMVIDHSGPGPGLVVNQNGANAIAEFKDDGVSVLYIADGGFVGFGTTAPAVSVDIRGTDAIRLPTGTTAQRPSVGVAAYGHVRFNTETLQYEGFGAGSAWGSLGGVKSVDGYTFVSAEQSPGSGDSNLRFVTSGVERMRVNPAGVVGIGTTGPVGANDKLVVVGDIRATGGVYGSNLSGSAFVDTTNADNITSGTLAVARLAASGVAAGTYGGTDAGKNVAVFTVDGAGRVTGASNTEIRLPVSRISGLAPSATTDTTNADNIASGTLNASRLAVSGVVAGNYGGVNGGASVGVFAIDAAGRVTGASNTPIAIAAGAVSGLAASATTDTTVATNITSGTLDAARLAVSGVTAATYGGTDAGKNVTVFTVDVAGRVTYASNTPIYLPVSRISGLAASATTDTTVATNITSGTLDAARLAVSGVVAGNYGGVNGGASVGVFAIDSAGRVTGASNTPIAIGVAAVSGLALSATVDTTNANNIATGTLNAARLAASGVTAGTYGNGVGVGGISEVAIVTVDVAGRVTAASNTPVWITAQRVSGLATVATSGNYNDLTNRTFVLDGSAALYTAGNVGIGTGVTGGTASATLYVHGDIFSSGRVTMSNLTVLGDEVILNTITSNTERIVVTNSGSGSALSVTQTGFADIAEFYHDEGLMMILADGGNVGIGTAIPLSMLHVAADARVDGTLHASNLALTVPLPAASVSGLAASATTDTTVATNITSGTLDAGRLATSGVVAGNYGGVNGGASVGVFAIDAAGRVTGASNTAIWIAPSQVSGLAASATTDTTNADNIASGTLDAARLAASGVSAGTYGGGSGGTLSVLTVDVAGRVTGASNTPIWIGAAQVGGLAAVATSGNYNDLSNRTFILGGDGGAAAVYTAGNVGVGTTNPLATFAIGGGGTDTTSTLMFNSGDVAGNTDKLYWTHVTNGSKIGHGVGWNVNHYAGQSGIGAGATNGSFHFFTGDTTYNERVTVLNNGNVGIGSSAPRARLEVAGGAMLNGTLTTNDYGINAGTGTITAATFSGTATQVSQTLTRGAYLTGANYNGGTATTWDVDATTAATASKVVARDAAGAMFAANVGIGTATVRAPLDVVGGAEFTAGNVGIGRDLSGGAPTRATLHVHGSVLCETTLTTSNLVVLGSNLILNTVTSNTQQVTITNDGTGPALRVTQTGAQPIADFYDDGALALRIADGGFVGIGTDAPAHRLDVFGAGAFSGTLYASNLVLTESIGSSQWTTSGVDPSQIYYSGGNVGIGTAVPTARLHVVGDIFATQSVSSLSDAAFKTNVLPLFDALGVVERLRGVSYDRIDTGAHEIGVIAQEVERLVPEVVSVHGGHRSVAYGNLTALLIEAVKTLSEGAKSQAKRLQELSDEVTALKRARHS